MALEDMLSGSVVPAFPGLTLTERLQAAFVTVRDVLSKYVADATMDASLAVATQDRVQAWMNDNRAKLEQTLSSSSKSDAVPADLILQMPKDEAANFVLSTWAICAQAVGAHLSGRLAPSWSPQDLDEDAYRRLQVMQSIVDLDQHGTLEQVFGASPEPAPAASGFGLLGLGAVQVAGWVIAVAIVAAIIGLLVFAMYAKREWAKVDVMTKACDAAMANPKNQLAVQACQQGLKQDPAKDLMTTGLVVAGGLGALYLFLMFGLPQVVVPRRI